MIPVKHYQLLYDCIDRGLERSYEDTQSEGISWTDAKALMAENIMTELCRYLDIDDEQLFIEFEPEPENDDED